MLGLLIAAAGAVPTPDALRMALLPWQPTIQPAHPDVLSIKSQKVWADVDGLEYPQCGMKHSWVKTARHDCLESLHDATAAIKFFVYSTKVTMRSLIEYQNMIDHESSIKTAHEAERSGELRQMIEQTKIALAEQIGYHAQYKVSAEACKVDNLVDLPSANACLDHLPMILHDLRMGDGCEAAQGKFDNLILGSGAIGDSFRLNPNCMPDDTKLSGVLDPEVWPFWLDAAGNSTSYSELKLANCGERHEMCPSDCSCTPSAEACANGFNGAKQPMNYHHQILQIKEGIHESSYPIRTPAGLSNLVATCAKNTTFAQTFNASLASTPVQHQPWLNGSLGSPNGDADFKRRGTATAEDARAACYSQQDVDASAELVLMADLVSGDRVLTATVDGAAFVTRVVANQHAAADKSSEMLTLLTTGGTSVSLTPDHALWIDGKLAAAAEAKVGSLLSSGRVVERVTTTAAATVINSVTISGTILASDAGGAPILTATHPIWIAGLVDSSFAARAVVTAAAFVAGDVGSVSAGVIGVCVKLGATLAIARMVIRSYSSSR